MEYKKLLKYLQNDLSELGELVDEKGKSGFDELELEFIQDRIKSAKKLIGLLAAKDVNRSSGNNTAFKKNEIADVNEAGIQPAPEIHSENKEIHPDKIKAKTDGLSEGINERAEKLPVENVDQSAQPDTAGETSKVLSEKRNNKENIYDKNSVELDDSPDEKEDKRLGDTFLKEKSVNDLMAADGKNLESKISNRPVASIKSAIGINDRFQFIRELFDGKAEQFTDTVEQLDSFGNIKEAVEYLQQNFKWKKTETSLKFVNLVKRRFPNG